MSIVAITGLSGEIGSSLIKEFGDSNTTVVDLYHSQPMAHPYATKHISFDLLDALEITKILQKIKPNTIIHMAGATHIDTCEADKVNGKEGKVWQMNVVATKKIADYCANTGCHLIYLSTECVFDGQQSKYSESDKPNPKNWYGMTKAAAEESIQHSGCDFTIIRAVIAFHPQSKNTLWQKIVHGIETKGVVHMANDHLMTPTYLPDISASVTKCLADRTTGIFHVAPSESITPYSFAQKIAEALGYSSASVVPTKLAEILGEERAQLRLKNACLNSTSTEKKLKIGFSSLDEVLKKL